MFRKYQIISIKEAMGNCPSFLTGSSNLIRLSIMMAEDDEVLVIDRSQIKDETFDRNKHINNLMTTVIYHDTSSESIV